MWISLGYNLVFIQEARGHSGGIWILSNRTDLCFTLIDSISQAITFTISKGLASWCCTVVYGSPVYTIRTSLWTHLKNLRNNIISPWLMIGDFNEIKSIDEVAELAAISVTFLTGRKKMVFGQVVVGPPGSGKTTYCNGMSQFLNLIGRKVAIVNLDPANDSLPYDCAVNIEDLVKLSDVMIEHSLGPNGGLVYCMDYLEKNIDWLEEKLKPLLKDHYLLFDFPGQVELFFLHSNAKNVIMKLIKKLSLRLMAVHLVDAHLCSDPGKYISALLLSLSTMLHLELPHINVLSKIDLIESYGKLAFNLDFYTDVQDLSYLQNTLDKDPHSAKYRKLTKELCEVIEHYSLVNFTTLDIQDKESVGNLVKLIDKTNGYMFAGIDASAVEFSKIAMGAPDWDYYRVAAVQEKYMKDDENIGDD
ncbi:GPN-loop GTPase qqt1 [Trifolium repens]|nr:GPN-loop GTPase qqt1 [Trifolium repens]